MASVGYLAEQLLAFVEGVKWDAALVCVAVLGLDRGVGHRDGPLVGVEAHLGLGGRSSLVGSCLGLPGG